MTNYVIFTDEHKDAEVHHEAAVILKIENASILQSKIQMLAVKLFPQQAKNNWIDLHSSPMWYRQREKKGWKTDWTEVDEALVFEFFRQTCQMINDLSEQIYVQRLRMRGTRNTYFQDPERYYAIRFLLHRVDALANKAFGSAEAFCDEESDHAVHRWIQAELHSYIARGERSPFNPPITRTLLPVHFVNSTFSAGVQAADVIAFIYGRYLANQKSPRKDFDKISELLRILTKLEKSQPWPNV